MCEIMSLLDEWPAVRKYVVVLEEPEKLTWFQQLVDQTLLILHRYRTNQLLRVRQEARRVWAAARPLPVVSQLVAVPLVLPPRHQSVLLGDNASQLHDVRPQRARLIIRHHHRGTTSFERYFYFLGTVLWKKGYHELFDLLDSHYAASGGERLFIDLFSNEPDLAAVQKRVKSSTVLVAVAVYDVFMV